MVRRGLASDRHDARRAIEAGRVSVAGAPATNPSRLVSPAEAVVRRDEPDRYVGRGGHKLAAALDRFAIDVAGLRALDAGSSTGGFTDCLLQAGAREVLAVDVGRGQLHQRLRTDPRVLVFERTDVRSLVPAELGSPFDLVVADLSFISLDAVLDSLVALARAGGELVLLVKPQFEATREEADAGSGVIDDPEVWRRTLRGAIAAAERRGATIMGLMTSPLRGADGNVEFLLHVGAPGGTPAPTRAGGPPVDALVDAVVDVVIDDPGGQA